MSKGYIEALARGLIAAGVRYIFGITGSGASLKLITKLQQKGVRYFPVGHEAAAAFMAGACCRDGRSRAVAITIKGPGFANLVPGILSNRYEGRPAITVSEAYDSDIPHYRAHKRMNHEAFCAELTKAYAFVDGKDDQIPRLVNFAQAEPPGPVHIDLGGTPVKMDLADSIGKHVINQSEIGEVLSQISYSQKPLLILGALAGRMNLIDLDKLKIPVVTTAAGKGSFDENSEFSGGIITGEIKPLSPEEGVIDKADLIVAIGLRNTEVIKATKYCAPLIMIDEIDHGLQDGFDPALKLIGCNAAKVYGQLLDTLNSKSWGMDVIDDYRIRILKALEFESWLPAGVFHKLQEFLPQKTTLVLDTGFFCTIGETVWRAATPENFCSSSIGRFMGAAIPTAIGVGVSQDKGCVLCVMGDGGVSPYLGEIKLAVNEKLPILFVCMSDGRYGSVAAFADNNKEVQRAVIFENPLWTETLIGLGCEALRIDNYRQLSDITSKWRNQKGPLFLELPFEPSSYAEAAKQLR